MLYLILGNVSRKTRRSHPLGIRQTASASTAVQLVHSFPVPGEGGPEGFYLRLGFRPTREEFDGEVLGELPL